ncbi:hypothetical protein [Kaistia sp. MMO-174]|uniref:hypothetical protein n=1 Tax=Kaistia sp. MMO-174 TaxID=3081256 RepID=UPI0030173BA2
MAPALADPPPPLPFALPLEVLEALADPEGPDEEALEWLPLLLVAEPAARGALLKARSDTSAADVTSDILVMEYGRMLETPLIVPVKGNRNRLG